MPPDPTPPLPLAANRAALSNRISMLLASQSSVLKSMALTRPSSEAQMQRRHRAAPADDDDDFLRGSRPNEGVGYVPETKDAAKTGNTREERMLRGKRGRLEDGKKGKRKEESESEDEVGRSVLGKRKRSRREAVEEENKEDSATVSENADVTMGESAEDDGEENNHTPAEKVSEGKDNAQNGVEGNEGAKKKRKKKNKKKKKQKAVEGQES